MRDPIEWHTSFTSDVHRNRAMVSTRRRISSTPYAAVKLIGAKSAGYYRYLLERLVVPVSSRVHSEDWVVDDAQIVR